MIITGYPVLFSGCAACLFGMPSLTVAVSLSLSLSDRWSLFDLQVEGHRARPHCLLIFILHSCWWIFLPAFHSLLLSLSLSLPYCVLHRVSFSFTPPPPSPLSSLRPQCLPVTPPLQFPSCLRGYQSHQELHQQPYTSHGSSAPITALLTNAQLINTAQRLFLLWLIHYECCTFLYIHTNLMMIFCRTWSVLG